MRDEINEQLSALTDDELGAAELQFLTRRLSGDDEALDQLGRYLLISDAIRGTFTPGQKGLVDRVSAALADEPAFNERPGRNRWRGVLRPAAGMAVAASVAMVMVSLWPRPEEGPQVATSTVAETAPSSDAQVVADGASSTPVQEEAVSATSSDGQWQTLDPEVQRRLNTYLVNHSEHSSTGRFGGVLTYVRIAGHEGHQ